jgi:hypothetical protein
MNTMKIRNASRIVQAKPLRQGAGFKAYSIGQQSLGIAIQPFLQLDRYLMSQPTFGEYPHQSEEQNSKNEQHSLLYADLHLLPTSVPLPPIKPDKSAADG